MKLIAIICACIIFVGACAPDPEENTGAGDETETETGGEVGSETGGEASGDSERGSGDTEGETREGTGEAETEEASVASDSTGTTQERSQGAESSEGNNELSPNEPSASSDTSSADSETASSVPPSSESTDSASPNSETPSSESSSLGQTDSALPSSDTSSSETDDTVPPASVPPSSEPPAADPDETGPDETGPDAVDPPASDPPTPASEQQTEEFQVNLNTEPADIFFQQAWCDNIANRYPLIAQRPTDIWCGMFRDGLAAMVGCFRGNELPDGSEPELEELIDAGDLEGGARMLDDLIFSLEDDPDEDSPNTQVSRGCVAEHYPADEIADEMYRSDPPRMTLEYLFAFEREISLLFACIINTQLLDDRSVTDNLARQCANIISQEASCAGIAGAWLADEGEGDMYQTCIALDDLTNSSDMASWLENAVDLAVREYYLSQITPQAEAV